MRVNALTLTFKPCYIANSYCLYVRQVQFLDKGSCLIQKRFFYPFSVNDRVNFIFSLVICVLRHVTLKEREYKRHTETALSLLPPWACPFPHPQFQIETAESCMLARWSQSGREWAQLWMEKLSCFSLIHPIASHWVSLLFMLPLLFLVLEQ